MKYASCELNSMLLLIGFPGKVVLGTVSLWGNMYVIPFWVGGVHVHLGFRVGGLAIYS